MRSSFSVTALVLSFLIVQTAAAQEISPAERPRGRTTPRPAAPAPKPTLERLGKDSFKLGAIEIDTARKELSITGTANPVLALEFVASTQNGAKAYESAVSLDTDGISFNTALLLIGMDPTHSRLPVRAFDPIPPAGDRLEISISWKNGDEARHANVEELLYDRDAKRPIGDVSWVYTGSAFRPNGRYMADVEGVLIGFMHNPSPVIENGAAQVGKWGTIIFNPTLGLAAETPITLKIKAAAPAR